MVRSRVSQFRALLESLDVPRGGVLYVQSSTDWLAKAGFGASEVLAGLRDWVTASGTLVMPSYPCRTTHAEYLASVPTFDVRRTPAAIGLIPEVFRRSPTARRSLDPDFSVVAEGPYADAITSQPLEEDPFGRLSVYEKMIALSASLLGLGVSLNTNSFIHVIDSRHGQSYPASPYLGATTTTVIDYDGVSRAVARRAVAPAFQQRTKPSAVVKVMEPLPHVLTSTSIEGAMFFRWNLAPWSAWCDAHAMSAAADRRWPCWLSQLPS
jgi:aminoglycoside N3'-acetyltransferase